jgi:hypothetical protein
MEWTHERVVYAAALGDSMSIDDYAGGPGRGAATLLWRNRDHDFPAWTGRDLTTIRDPTARLVLVASDGATSAMVAGDQFGRLRRRRIIPTLATVTMGGKDLLAAYGDATAARRTIGTVAGKGRRLLAGLRDLMGARAPAERPSPVALLPRNLAISAVEQMPKTNCRRRSWSAGGTPARWWGRGASSETPWRAATPGQVASVHPRVNAHA